METMMGMMGMMGMMSQMGQAGQQTGQPGPERGPEMGQTGTTAQMLLSGADAQALPADASNGMDMSSWASIPDGEPVSDGQTDQARDMPPMVPLDRSLVPRPRSSAPYPPILRLFFFGLRLSTVV